MSFEGYYQFICDGGHLYQVDVYDDETECHDCGGKPVWQNLVDETNGYDDGIILEEDLRPMIIEAGSSKRETRYRPPTCLETVRLRKFRDGRSGEYYRETHDREIDLTRYCEACGSEVDWNTGYCPEWHTGSRFLQLLEEQEKGEG